MAKVIIGPLGWNQEIFKLLEINDIDLIIIFPKIETNIDDFVNSILGKISKLEAIDFYAFSYGGAFLNYLYAINKDLFNQTNSICYFDCHPIDSIPNIEQLETSRQTKFTTDGDACDYYLDSEDHFNDFKIELVKSQFNNEESNYHHFLSNNDFLSYLKLPLGLNILRYHPLIKITTYSCTKIKSEYIPIDPNCHLMMIECPTICNHQINHQMDFVAIDNFWLRFLNDKNLPYFKYSNSFNLGFDSNGLLELVLAGKKKATSSLYKQYELEDESLPRTGDFNIILDDSRRPCAIIHTKDVKIISFDQFTYELTKLEGEGSHQYWIDSHTDFFRNELKAYNIKFSPDMKIVFEIFDIVYPSNVQLHLDNLQ